MRRLILRSFQSPGDIVMLTAAVRDLHTSNPGQFETDVRTSAEALWDNNPYITRLSEASTDVESLDMHYPLIHHSNQRPYHFLHGYPQYLEERLGVKVAVTQFKGDIHLSQAEKQSSPFDGESLPDRYWIIVAGGKYDFTAKWWNPASYQRVVDHFQGKIHFVQIGEAGHWHPPLTGVTNLVGKTSTRQFVRLMHHAEGVVCPVTFAMHLAAAVETRNGRPKHRPCVVIAGGREPTHWEAYPHHQYLTTVGALPCCADGGCWKSRCQPVGDGDSKDLRDLCDQPVQLTPDLRIPKCLNLITAADVIRRIELYYEGGAMSLQTMPIKTEDRHGYQPTVPQVTVTRPLATQNVLLNFDHGLGDAVQLTAVLRHLQHYHPEWNIDVQTLIGKHSAYQGLCRRVYIKDRDPAPCCQYQQRHSLEWHENLSAEHDWPSTKVTRCLQEIFQLTPIPELCQYQIAISSQARQRAADYLESISGPPDEQGRFKVVLIHYEGNTSSEKKNLPPELVQQICEDIIRLGYVPVILDWDRRSSLPDQQRIYCPDADHPLWGEIGTGDAEALAALIDVSRLMIGVDSGPLHVAAATNTPTIGVWTHHHPVHYFDLAPNVLHLVHPAHSNFTKGPVAVAYFQQNYRYRAYSQLHVDLPAVVESELTGADVNLLANKQFLRQLNATGYDISYYEEHRRAGLDYLGFGEWQQQYGRWLVESLGYAGRRMLDVGCACGSILRGLGQAGAIVQGVDVCESMIQLGRQQWPDMASLLFTCDAVNLHLFKDQSWDGLHSAQSAEHWKPELVPFILRELARITTPGGLFFCALDTEELFARQGRTLEHEDPTHICIKPLAWWHQQLAENGWTVCTEELRPALIAHRENFLSRYDWDFFVARRKTLRPLRE